MSREPGRAGGQLPTTPGRTFTAGIPARGSYGGSLMPDQTMNAGGGRFPFDPLDQSGPWS